MSDTKPIPGIDVDLSAEDSPEIKLRMAILYRSIQDLMMPQNEKQARRWFYSSKRDSMSFYDVCEALDLSPTDLLREIESGISIKKLKESEAAPRLTNHRTHQILVKERVRAPKSKLPE